MACARTLLAGVLAIALAPLSGCGRHQYDDGSCAVTDPCGGDLVGTWLVQRSCTLLSTASCTASAAFHPSLTYVFRADGTFTLSGNRGGTYVSDFSGSCSEDGGTSCALDEEGKKNLVSPDAYEVSGSCGPLNDVMCSCLHHYRPTPLDPISGTYRVEGVTLQLETPTVAGNTATDSSAYCVSGSSLHLLKIPSADGGSTSGPNDVDLVRQ
jgi:hypothetical protein